MAARDCNASRDVEQRHVTSYIVALAIHGGAGGTTTPNMPADLIAAYRQRLRTVLSTTYEHRHPTSLEAVCDAVSQLEDSPLFNAAKGAVFDLAGHTVCESSLMTTQPGFHSNTVAVTGVRRTKNPILLSKVLLENNTLLGGHAFYSGESAEKAGWHLGTQRVSTGYYWTKRRWLEHKRALDPKLDKLAELVAHHTQSFHDNDDMDRQDVQHNPPAYSHSTAAIQANIPSEAESEPELESEPEHQDQSIFDRYAHLTDLLPQGTVGAVALDSNGHLSVATSTGGKTNKYPGRIGDTPSVGSGFWADCWSTSRAHPRRRCSTAPLLQRLLRCILPNSNSSADNGLRGIAISGTGDGDFFLRTNFASSLAHRIKYADVPFDQAIETAMDELVHLYGSEQGVGGAILLDRQGNAYFPLAASTMNRGLISKSTAFQPKVAIFDHEHLA